MSGTPHPIIEHLRRNTLNVDAAWSEDIAGGFRWWPSQQCQRILADAEMSASDGDKLCRLVVETDIATLNGSGMAAREPLGALARLATLSGMVLSPDGTLRLHSHVWVAESTRELYSVILGAVAGLQVFEAAVLALHIQEAGLGTMAASPHPRSGLRSEPDEIAGVAQSVFCPIGEEDSRFIGDEFLQIDQQFLQQPPCLLGMADEDGLTAEFPFGSESSLVQIQTDQAHPILGHGLLVRSAFQVGNGLDPKLDSLTLNSIEIERAESNFLGSWIREDGTLHFATFVPNLLARPNLLTNFFLFAINRARFVSTLLLDDDWSETWDEDGNCRAKSSAHRAVEQAAEDAV